MISIRAPARGATKDGKYYSICWAFQSALPRGERLFSKRLRTSLTAISIRAPARGATSYQRVIGIAYTFQSALPRGERLESSPQHTLY